MRKKSWWGAASLIAASCALLAPTVALPASLPDGRGYEMVSPPDKAGGGVAIVTARTRAAVDGSAIMFISLTAFGDAPGSGVETEYIAQRTAGPATPGWATHGVIPKQDPLALPGITAAGSPGYVGQFSPDLSTGLFRAWSPLTDDPDVGNVENLYVRRDLRTPGQGTYSLVTACPACAGTPLRTTISRESLPFTAGASDDFEQVLFESQLDLTGDGRGVPKLYLSDNGVVRLIGKVPPNGEIACSASAPAPACVLPADNGASIAGLGASLENLTPNVISDDGELINFTAPTTAQGAVMSDSNLYQANSHGTAATADDTIVRLNVSERTVPDNPAGARYQTASSDGSRVFFISQEALTDDTPTGFAHLYMWQRDPLPGGGHLSLIDRDDELRDAPGAVEGLIGASDDGTHVYFVANSQLVAGADPVRSERRGIYLWHNGTIDFIGSFTSVDNSTDWVRNTLVGQGTGMGFGSMHARVTSDGKAMLFSSTNGSGLTDYDHNTTGCGPNGLTACTEYYLYRAEDHRLTCATCNPSGQQATSDVSSELFVLGGNAVRSGYLHHPLTEDGRRVFFSSGDALVREDTNGKYDAYQYDAPTGTISLLSSGKSTADSYFLDASASGNDVFFATKEQLVGWDVDDSYDLYDARVGGGFPDPLTPPALCNGSTCQGPLINTPPSSTPGSTTYAGTGNTSQRIRRANRARKCRRGKTRRRINGKKRCVKRVRHKRSRRR